MGLARRPQWSKLFTTSCGPCPGRLEPGRCDPHPLLETSCPELNPGGKGAEPDIARSLQRPFARSCTSATYPRLWAPGGSG